jgi:L-ascorbate metabolism protein UlaG (beta-lactamase superfamily)
MVVHRRWNVPSHPASQGGRIKGARARSILIAALLASALPISARASPDAAERAGRLPVKITFLGNAGWQIEDGKTTILIDPNLSEFRNDRTDTAQLTADDLIARPDADSIDAHVHKADYILITHGHDDHMIDAPYIARKTGAVIICHQSAANIARAYGIGEDLQFASFSLAVIPSLHTALFDKRYNDGFWAGSTPAGLRAPLHESDYKEGGTLMYPLRIAGHQIFIVGSMNYIEREITGMRPDIAIIGAGPSRKEVYRYTSRLMKALGNPPVVLPTHWDGYGTRPRAEVLKEVAGFAAEVRAASPHSEVVIPDYFVPIERK